MSIEKKFSDTEGYDDTLGVTVWDMFLRGQMSLYAQGDGGEAYISVDIHEFKDWFDQAYAEVFGRPQRKDSLYVVMAATSEGGWDVPEPIGIYTDVSEAIKARDSAPTLGEARWVITAPLNPDTSDRKDQA